ncbi:MAG: ClbS/DfsB family four-helix bundle protein [Muribaculaceae bacterium]|nr:ClbS/DfsB family four-helix bundle protein [Muribaculaceae bacterium]
MAKPTHQAELITAMQDGYAKLYEQIDKLSAETAVAPFNFAADSKKCGVRWVNDRCLRDILTHLYEWQVLMREFVKNIREGHQRDYLPDEYRKNYHEMDKMLVEKHQNTSLDEAKTLLAQTHQEMLGLVKSFDDNQLFSRGVFKCTYTTTMAAYFESVTTSPYSQATKILKTHAKTSKA